MNNLKAERTLTAEELQGEFARIIRDEVVADYTGSLLGVDRAVKALASIALQSLSTQQPMGEVTDKVWFAVLNCPHEITGNEIVLRYTVTKEGRNASDQLRMRIFAALHPNQESGE